MPVTVYDIVCSLCLPNGEVLCESFISFRSMLYRSAACLQITSPFAGSLRVPPEGHQGGAARNTLQRVGYHHQCTRRKAWIQRCADLLRAWNRGVFSLRTKRTPLCWQQGEGSDAGACHWYWTWLLHSVACGRLEPCDCSPDASFVCVDS